MNRLRNMRIYLAGCIDRVADDGVVWRRQIRKSLKDHGILWLDPTDKPTSVAAEDPETRRVRHQRKAAGDYKYVANEMKIIRATDLRLVDIADALIVNIDVDVHAAGTYEELYLANRQRKPVLVRTVQSVASTPDWLFGTLPYQHFFGDWDSLIKYLHHVDADPEIETYNRWKFFDFTGDGS